MRRLAWFRKTLLIAVVLSAVAGGVWWWTIGIGPRHNPAPPRGPLRVVVLGDSLALGYGAPNPPRDGFIALLAERLARKRAGSTFENDAVGGMTIGMLAFRELPRVRTDPDVVVAISGGNDVEFAAPPPVIAAETAEMLDTLHHRFPRAHIVVTDIPDVSRVPIVPRFARAPFHALIVLDNLAFRRVARAHGATVLPLYKISVSKLAADPANFSTDGLHPSSLGYKRLAAQIWPSFERALVR